LNGILNTDGFDLVTVSWPRSKSYEIACLELINRVIPAMICDSGEVAIVQQHALPTIIGLYTNLTSGRIDRRHIGPNLTRLECRVLSDLAPDPSGSNLV
jgi:hypothetical protein